MKILIVDDQVPNRLIAKFHVEAEGHTCIEAENGQDAIEKFLKYKPDFVLMDIVMPVMDGYEAAYYIKSYAAERHTPIIFLTAKHDENSLQKCLECGGDDYLIKPINGTLLKAKIGAHLRTLELTQQIQAKNNELSEVYANLSREHEMGRHVLLHTLERNLKDCPNIQQYMSSMSTFNGDIFLIAENPSGGLYVFLGDFTGHGLSAAIGTIPISQMFFEMCEKGESVSDIVFAMNHTLKEFLPEHMFCAATMIHLFERGDCAHIWTGGLPSAYIVRPGEGIIQTVSSKNMPLGILDDQLFNNNPEFFRFEKNDRLVMFSDGILEGTRQGTDEMFGEERVKAQLENGGEQIFSNLLKSYFEFIGEQKQHDDISLIELVAQPYETKFIRDLQLHNQSNKAFLPWKIQVEATVDQIKSTDVLSLVMGLLPSSIRISYRFDVLRTVLSELYANALEHGLLNISSSMKDTPEGFAEYYKQRDIRLQNLDDGFIHIHLSSFKEEEKIKVKILLQDSGEGFSYREELSQLNQSLLWGRGISLVKSLSEFVSYNSKGNEVEAIVLMD